MFEEQSLIQHLKNKTNYEVFLTDQKQIDSFLGNENDLLDAKIFVGHKSIRLQNPNELWSDGYQELENPQVLLTEINILCKRNHLVTVRTNIYKAYTSFDPVPQDTSFSRLTLVQSDLAVINGINVFWREVVGMVFPRILKDITYGNL